MTNLEKVIKDLQFALDGTAFTGWGFAQVHKETVIDALELLKERQWISVKDRMPEVGQMVLILSRYGHVIDAKFTQYKGKYYFDPFGYELSDSYVTHWMPLPEPPKEDKDDDE